MSYPVSELGAAFARRVRSSVATAFALAAALAISYAPAHAQQTGTIVGTVTSTSGEPLSAVAVQVLGTDPVLSVTTDNRGRYIILGVPVGTHQVQVSLIGYGAITREAVVAAGGSVEIEFRLQQRAVELEGMVVTGTAINAQKREVGNSIELITSEEIAASGAVSVTDILRGRIPGMEVSGTSATPGVGAEISIRGLNSIFGRRTPLIYVDGVRTGTENGSFDGSTGENGALHVLGSISPEDIERIEVIKGAAASTLYGTDATAGVIQIFTKRGQAGERARWTFRSQTSLVQPSHFGDPDIDPTGMHLNRCDINGPLPQDTFPEADPDCPESGSWFKNAWSQNYSLNARGGSQDFSYFASAGWENQQGVINTPSGEEIGLPQTDPDGSQAENLFLRANFTFNPFEAFEVQINSAYARRDVDFIQDGFNSSGLVWNVTRLREGSVDDDRDAQIFLHFENQVVDQYTISTSMNWLPRDNMSHRLNAGFDRSFSTRVDERKRGHFAQQEGDRTNDFEENRVITLDYAGNLAWRIPGADAYSFTSSWGGQLNDRESGGLRGDAEGFITRNRTLLEQGADITNLNESHSAFINGGFFLQQQIGWNNQLFITGGLRFDSYNTVNARLESVPLWQTFPKLQATYTVSDNDWFPSNVIETLRFRSAWGTAGDPPSQTATRTLWDFRATGRGNVGFAPNSVGNPAIGPERVSEWEIGADVGAFQGRLNLSGQYFYRSTTDGLIENDPIPSLGIIEPQAFNAGEWDSWGYEATLDANLVQTDNFRWNVNSTFSYQNSEIKNLGLEEDNELTQGTADGSDLPQTGEFDAGAISFRLGHPQGAFFDMPLLNDGERGALPVYGDSSVFIGVQRPPYQLSLNTSFGIGERLTLDFFGSGQFGHILIDGQSVRFAEDGLLPQCIEVNRLMDRWVDQGGDPDLEPGEMQTVPVPAELTAGEIGRCWASGNPDAQDWYDEGDYFRFASASAQYRLPEAWLPGAISGATVQFQALNLNLFTDFNGTDPDAIRGSGLQQRSRALGFTVPLPRTYSLNIRLNF